MTFILDTSIAAPPGAETIDLNTVVPVVPPLGDFGRFLERLTAPPVDELRLRLFYDAITPLFPKIDIIQGGLGNALDSVINWRGDYWNGNSNGAWTEANGFAVGVSGTRWRTGYIADGVGKQYQLADASAVVAVTVAGPASTSGFLVRGPTASPDTLRGAFFVASGPATRINDATTTVFPAPSSRVGIFGLNRIGSAKSLYYNGALLNTVDVPPTALTNSEILLGGTNSADVEGSAKMIIIGAGLTPSEHAFLAAQMAAFLAP